MAYIGEYPPGTFKSLMIFQCRVKQKYPTRACLVDYLRHTGWDFSGGIHFRVFLVPDTCTALKNTSRFFSLLKGSGDDLFCGGVGREFEVKYFLDKGFSLSFVSRFSLRY